MAPLSKRRRHPACAAAARPPNVSARQGWRRSPSRFRRGEAALLTPHGHRAGVTRIAPGLGYALLDTGLLSATLGNRAEPSQPSSFQASSTSASSAHHAAIG